MLSTDILINLSLLGGVFGVEGLLAFTPVLYPSKKKNINKLNTIGTTRVSLIAMLAARICKYGTWVRSWNVENHRCKAMQLPTKDK